MHGTVTKKGNRWYAVIYEGIDDAGKQKRRWITGGARRADAERVLADLIRKKHEGEPLVAHKGTLGQYLTERWLPVQESRLRHSTHDSYRRNIDLHVLPALGQRQLAKLSPADLDLFYADLLTKGRRGKGSDKKGLAPKTVRNVHVMLNKALSDAQRKGLVVRNVAELADPPKLSAQRREEVRAWDADQLWTFLDAMAIQRFFPAFHLSAHTGMRRGEILGLRWGDVDLELGRVSVRQALVSVAYEVHVSDVKTGNGRRTIDIEEDAIAVLDSWRALRTEERGGKAPAKTDLVFSRPDGSWLHPDLFSQIFDRVVAKLDVPEITLHDLRHTHATILLMNGVPVKVVSERLGHASPAFTMSVYQHVLPGMQAEAAELFAEVLRQAAERKRASESCG
jgi:integrase